MRPTGPDDFLFMGQRGPWTAQAIQQLVKKYLKNLGLYENEKSVHALRHSYAVEFYKQQKDLRAEFARRVSGTDPFKAMTYRIINLPFADKYRLLRGILDGPIVIGHSTLIAHVGRDSEDEMMKILHSCGMTVRHNRGFA